MSMITTQDGTQIYYKGWGEGQPVVFSHGWRCCWAETTITSTRFVRFIRAPLSANATHKDQVNADLFAFFKGEKSAAA